MVHPFLRNGRTHYGPSFARERQHDGGGRCHILDLADKEHYFNSGIMLIDLKRWRDEDVGAKAIACVKLCPERMLFADQCALNAVIHTRWLSLDPAWNVMRANLEEESAGRRRYVIDASRRAKKARIVHFNSTPKPSFYMCHHSARHEYNAYRRKTVWGRKSPSDYYSHNVIIKFLENKFPILLPFYVKSRRYI